jgi:hypothetical protein
MVVVIVGHCRQRSRHQRCRSAVWLAYCPAMADAASPLLVFVVGPPAVGKMSVGQAIAERTGLRLFHNHLAIELTASCSSLTTGRSPVIRVPTNATECASVASVLRP